MANKIKIIVSDLHIGAGREEKGNLLEDFISDAAFREFLEGLVAESEADRVPVELIINGDFVEMLQVPATEAFDPLVVYSTLDYEESTEAAAVKKVRHVMDGHPEIFTALAAFINPGQPQRTVTITKGNHDPEQFWAGWQNAVRARIGATGDRARLLRFVPVSFTEDGVYIEHGNQYLGKLDSFTDFASPLDPDHPERVEHPIGSKFGVRVVNDMERQRFWVDSIYPATALAWYLLRWDFRFAARMLAGFLAAGIEVMGGELLGRAVGDETQQLVDDLQDEARLEELAQQYESDPAFQGQFNRQLLEALEAVEVSEPLDMDVRGLGEEPSAQEIGQSILDGSVLKLREVAEGIVAGDPAIKVVSFGHTHVPEEIELANGGVYINTGTWIWRGDFSQADEATWRDLMENPRNYSRERTLHYARVEVGDDGQPTARLMVFEPGQRPETQPPAEAERAGCLPRWLRGR